MDTNSRTLEQLVADFEKRSVELYQDVVPARSSARMQKASEDAWQLAQWVTGYKEDARQRKDEEVANMLLGAQCFASALASEIDMWIAIKANDPDRAWTCLIDMQEYLEISARAHATELVVEFAARAAQHEDTLFPPVVFMSSGCRYRPGICTICGAQFDQCPHEEDVIYVGRVCREINRQEIHFDHVAIVKEPRDKRCRLASMADEQGVSRHWFSREVIPEKGASETDRSFNAILHNFGSLKNI